jgi:hypothetical protein
MWTSRALKDYANNWFVKRTTEKSSRNASFRGSRNLSRRDGSSYTKLWDKDHWLPGLTGEMISWMKLGSYKEFDVKPLADETMIRKVDSLEGVIDRLMNSEAVQNTISKFLNVKETIEQEADQNKEKIFTSKVIDSQMGKKLGVTDTGVENHKVEGTKYISPKEDNVENFNLVCKLSAVKQVFQ